MTATSDFAPVSSRWFFEVQARSSIQAIIERGFILKRVSLIIKLAKLVIAVNSTALLYVYKINNLESVVFSNLLILLLSLGSLDLANDGLKPLGTLKQKLLRGCLFGLDALSDLRAYYKNKRIKTNKSVRQVSFSQKPQDWAQKLVFHKNHKIEHPSFPFFQIQTQFWSPYKTFWRTLITSWYKELIDSLINKVINVTSYVLYVQHNFQKL